MMIQNKLKLFLAFALMVTLSQFTFAQKNITGIGTVTDQKREVRSFTGISLESSADVEISQGATPSVIIETYPNIAELLETVVENNILHIRQKKLSRGWYNMNVDRAIKLKITNPTYNQITLSSSGSVTAVGNLTATDLQLKVNGSGDLKLPSLNAKLATVKLNGSGSFQAEGAVDDLNITLIGSGDANVVKIPAKNITAAIMGSGNIRCNASVQYDLRISGSGSIGYVKTGATLKSKTTGSGDIHPE